MSMVKEHMNTQQDRACIMLMRDGQKAMNQGEKEREGDREE